MRKIEVLFVIVFAVIALFIISLPILLLLDEVTKEYLGTIKTQCYDRWNNKIDDVTCTNEVYCGIVTKFFDDCPIKEVRE